MDYRVKNFTALSTAQEDALKGFGYEDIKGEWHEAQRFCDLGLGWRTEPEVIHDDFKGDRKGTRAVWKMVDEYGRPVRSVSAVIRFDWDTMNTRHNFYDWGRTHYTEEATYIMECITDAEDWNNTLIEVDEKYGKGE